MLSNFVIFLLDFYLLLIVASEDDIRFKRSDIDLQTCIDKFDVHKDKIIRTQDSQNMGAKYLNEMDLGSREECLHLCCETENCDVFVFEEKKSGSCYLFHCGPPEDFKCKFTHHVNYSSAILSINRHRSDLESQIQLTKHEQDLSKLRKPDIELEPSVHLLPEIRTTPPTTTTTIAALKEIIPAESTNIKKQPEEDPKCTRFQFECRSTRECIAVYNVCDGIPQCPDGSDEGPGCPESAVTTATAYPIHPNSVPVQSLLPERYDNNIPQHQAPPALPPVLQNQQILYPQQQPQLIHETPRVLPPNIQRNDQEYVQPASSNINSRLPYDSPGLQPYIPQLPPQGQTNWIPHQSNQLPPQITQYADKASRIFNHKETGFQVPDGQEISQVGLPSYTKIGNYFPENTFRQPLQQENWPSENGIYEQGNVQENLPNRAVPKIEYPLNTPRELPHKFRKTDDVVNPKHIQEQLAQDLKHSKDNMPHGNTHNNKIVKKQHLKHEEEQYPDFVAYKMSGANDLEDGVAQTQKGAVLSVSLGLIITLIMAILIGCRLKVVRRRLRKGGKAYAHDADFLVNGMYL